MTDPAEGSPPRPRWSIRDVAAAALQRADTVLAHWLPDGQRKGHEYVARNPRRSDARAGSFSVSLAKGAWSDFATGDKGGDLVALVAYLDAIKQGEAAERLAGFLGLSPDTIATTPPRAHNAKGKADAVPVSPVPDDAPPPPRAHPAHGLPSHVWTYRDAAGRALFHVARFDGPDGKQVLPLSLWREHGALRWHWKGVPTPRPLYGLDRLAARPDALAIVCEGEKDADAAGELLPECVAITSPNGSRSAKQADWTPVKGRRVLVWPDADAPGEAYARDVLKLTRAAGAASVAVLRLDALAKLRGDALPAGWGAGDALAEGIDRTALVRLLGDPANLATPQAAAASPTDARADVVAGPFMLIEPGEGAQRPGVYFIPRARDKRTGELVEGAPEWITSPLRVEALTRDDAGAEWGRLLAFPDRDGNPHRWAMPCAMLAKDGAELREVLLSQGLEITADPNRRRRLGEYIQAAEPGRFARCVTRTGWHGSVFVLPDRTIGPADVEALVFQSAAPDGAKVAECGTLAEWRERVALPCAGNSRLVLALSAAFAAPCLHLAGVEGGGLHFRGPSSCGKSTALALAASVYGPPEYRREWRVTDNGLEGLAALHCDALLPLDEMGQLDPKHAAASAYLLSNGQGKSRSRRDGSLRAPLTWRLLFLSCGEIGLADLIAENGGRHRAGMEVRAIDLTADAGAGLGLFERLPDSVTAGAFADALRAAAATCYGTAFPAFLGALVGNLDKARKALRDFVRSHTGELVAGDAAGQVRRVAQRFAVIGAAGELATLHGITGWRPGEAKRAASACFASWLAARGGRGEAEPRAMLRQVQAFIGANSEGRFADMNRVGDDRAPRTLNSAGYRVDTDNGREHWVYSETWRREVCAGFDATEVARVLADRQLLKPDGKGYTRRERIKGSGEMVRVYRLLPGLLDVEP